MLEGRKKSRMPLTKFESEAYLFYDGSLNFGALHMCVGSVIEGASYRLLMYECFEGGCDFSHHASMSLSRAVGGLLCLHQSMPPLCNRDYRDSTVLIPMP